MLKSMKIQVLASTSALAMSLAPQLAIAQCTPNPTQDFSTTTCSGVETNGLTVASRNSAVNILAGASILAPNVYASAVTITSSASPQYYYRSVDLTNGGLIDGGAQAGILVTSQPSPSTNAAWASVTVNAGGVIQGAHGIAVSGDASNAAIP